MHGDGRGPRYYLEAAHCSAEIRVEVGNMTTGWLKTEEQIVVYSQENDCLEVAEVVYSMG